MMPHILITFIPPFLLNVLIIFCTVSIFSIRTPYPFTILSVVVTNPHYIIMVVINVAEIFVWSHELMLLVIPATAYTFKIAAIYRAWIRQKVEKWENGGNM